MHKKKTIEELCRMDVEEFKEAKKLPLAVVLDNVRSLHNVGSVLRTADAFRLCTVHLCGITACPPSAEIHKTALGAEDSVDWAYFKSTMESVERLKRAGFKVFAAEQTEESISLDRFIVEKMQPYAIIMGNEVAGVQQEVIDACDGTIEIPQFGTKHSLNVSVSAGIVIWELARQMLPTIE